MELIYQIIDYLSYTTPIILLAGFFLCIYLKNKSKTNQLILLLFILGLSIDILSRIFARLYNNNLVFINIYNIVDLVILFLIIKSNSPNFKKGYWVFFVLILFYNFYDLFSIDFNKPLEYQSYSRSINSIFLLFISLLQLVKDIISNEFDQNKQLLIYLAIFLILNAFLNIPINFLINYSNYTIFIIWLINTININFFYSYLIYYIWKSGKIQK